MWLNFGCVLRLQVADSIPAQVSGSQSVPYVCLCVCVCVCWDSSTLFLPLSEQLALPRNWKNVSMDSSPTLPRILLLFISFACLALNIKSSSLLYLFSPPLIAACFLPPSLLKPASDDCLERARRNLPIWQDVMLPDLAVTLEAGDIDSGCVCFLFFFLPRSCAAPSSRRSAKRKPNPSRPMTRWRR